MKYSIEIYLEILLEISIVISSEISMENGAPEHLYIGYNLYIGKMVLGHKAVFHCTLLDIYSKA